mmetsp:Transcript_1402/g.2337  ORF Transcript_1402/g.2337 Transcript_1402/m.2337 type:complete len:180 (-) Transcript_1402:45-584(-)|eukprot:CAMPEP_0181019822 /NCGR_PEP_ID=MMETSP1070-20121207/124_1 /TAXON_ID=265543 /ORGANISM="Minutocellus polymorphus, Strain NH13" /LENGTH=179 /DNA_ID=CAMNT_0023096599 /DNA_START=245 /DNA_END=784 /DNA_ORIENTATION=-
MCATTGRLLSDDATTDAAYGTTDAAFNAESSIQYDKGSTAAATTSVTVGLAWLLLILAILLEVAGTTSMKLSDGFTRLIPSILIYVLYAASFTLFPFALQAIELSTAYAVWSGLGTTVTAIIGFVYFQDTVNKTKILALTAIVCGCIVLNFADEIEKVEEVERESSEYELHPASTNGDK